ncbi:MAG: imidazole glycerol phosphate synthase glutamine amidotransferase subunit [Planctomycetota bacterium]|jgi:imidazole glycerol phosphate synthase glutamine amidotransferase subunit
MRDVCIVPTGTANVASVCAAFERLGARPQLCSDPAQIARAERVVLPGVGAFAAAASRLDQLGLRQVLRDRVQAERPTLAICLGMQLFCADSDESPQASGLAVVKQSITRFAPGLRVPQVGWNRVLPIGSTLLQPGYAYFVHSYRLAEMPDGWNGAMTDYGGQFVSALERGAVLACQFHPEISGEYGQALLERWLQRSDEVAPC